MTLTDVVYYFRKSAPILGVGLILLIFFFFSIKFLFSVLFKPQQEASQTGISTTACFGKLKPLLVETEIDYPSQINFTLDTIEGKPITASSSAQVFFLKKKLTRFGYLQKATLIAKAVGFDTEVIQPVVEDRMARFDDGVQNLAVDITNFNFEYESDYKNLPNLFENLQIPSEAEITETARQLLRTTGTYSTELSQGKENVIYLKYDPIEDVFETVETPQEANAVEVDFFRSDIGSLSIVPPKYYNSQNFVILIFKDERHKVLKAQVKLFELEDQETCMYPLKTGDQALEELKAKQGFIISKGSGTTSVVIKKMFLGYYDPQDYQEYLQPVYVFLSDQGFVGYVPAVREGYLTE